MVLPDTDIDDEYEVTRILDKLKKDKKPLDYSLLLATPKAEPQPAIIELHQTPRQTSDTENAGAFKGI